VNAPLKSGRTTTMAPATSEERDVADDPCVPFERPRQAGERVHEAGGREPSPPGTLGARPRERVVQTDAEIEREASERGERSDRCAEREPTVVARAQREREQRQGDEERLRPAECCGGGEDRRPSPAPTQRGERCEGDGEQDDALRIREREDDSDGEDRQVRRRTACEAGVVEQRPRERLERDERGEEREIREQGAGSDVAEAECVHATQKQRVQREERGVALAPGLEQVAVLGDDPVPAAVPRREDPEQVHALVAAREDARPVHVQRRRGGEHHGASGGPPGDEPAVLAGPG
jgi:hypothetical protein